MARPERPEQGSSGSRRGIKRKGPARVVSLIAKKITQAEIREALMLQAAAWQSERGAHKFITALELRLGRGAAIEEGPLDFDPRPNMVRTQKVKAG